MQVNVTFFLYLRTVARLQCSAVVPKKKTPRTKNRIAQNTNGLWSTKDIWLQV